MGMNPRTLCKAVKEGRNTFKFRGKQVCVLQKEVARFSVHESSDDPPLKFFEKETQVAEWFGLSRQTINASFNLNQTEKTIKKDGKEWILKRVSAESSQEFKPDQKSSPKTEVPSPPKPIPAPRRKTLPPPIPAPRRKAATPPSPIPAEEEKEEKKEEEKYEEKYCWPPYAQDPRNPFHPDLRKVNPDCNIHNAICDFYANYNLFLPEGKRVRGWGEEKNETMQTVLVAPSFMDLIGPTDTYEDFEFYCGDPFYPSKEVWESHPEMGIFPLKMTDRFTGKEEQWHWRVQIIDD